MFLDFSARSVKQNGFFFRLGALIDNFLTFLFGLLFSFSGSKRNNGLIAKLCDKYLVLIFSAIIALFSFFCWDSTEVFTYLSMDLFVRIFLYASFLFLSMKFLPIMKEFDLLLLMVDRFRSSFEFERLWLFLGALGLKNLICSQRLLGSYFFLRRIVFFLVFTYEADLVWLDLLFNGELLSGDLTPVYLSTMASVLVYLGFS